MLAAIAATLLATSPLPPPQLRCLEKYYGVSPSQVDGRWFAILPDGTRHVFDDGRTKSFEEKLASPDIEDQFSPAYTVGPIRPVTRVDHDPGRVRYDALFFAVYGRAPEQVDLVPLTFLGQRLRVHRKVAPAFGRVEKRLLEVLARSPGHRKYLRNIGGTFNWRKIAGTDRQSAHSYGVSMDINVKHSAYWRWQKPRAPIAWRNEIPQEIVDAFEAEGFIWGGRWYHYDTMHFEYRPELVDPSCLPATK